MPSFATILAYLAFAGAIASWIVGAVFFVRTLRSIDSDTRLRWLAIVAWPFAVSRITGRGRESKPRTSTRRWSRSWPAF